MLLVFNEEGPEHPSPEARAPWARFEEDAAKLATLVGREGLHSSATASVVSVRDGSMLATDGAYLEGKEQLRGFYVFDCEDLDVAVKLAEMIPSVTTGHVEIRPVVDLREMEG